MDERGKCGRTNSRYGFKMGKIMHSEVEIKNLCDIDVSQDTWFFRNLDTGGEPQKWGELL